MKILDSITKSYSIWRILTILSILLIGITYLDWNNIPSAILEENSFWKIVWLPGILLLIALCKELHIDDLPKIKHINFFDFCLVEVFLLTICYALLCTGYGMWKPYKLVVLVILFVATLYLLIVRQRQYVEAREQGDSYEGNTIDLKDLYEGNVEPTIELLFLDENEVEYDLLNRQSIINHLCNVLRSCRPQGHFVIGLEGRWGSGKTTILKNVKRMLNSEDADIVIIDDFDPWVYGNEQAMIEGFLNRLFLNENLNISSAKLKKSVSVLAQAVISSSEKRNVLEKLLSQERSVEESKKIINEYLHICGKKIVFFIDNIDRLDDEKVLLVFKLIATVLDFDRVIFVLSYDVEKVEQILDQNLNIDHCYLEKIVQLQIGVPECDARRMQLVIQQSTQNLLKIYGVDEVEQQAYLEFVSLVAEHIRDLRAYKRIVNSVIMRVMHQGLSLSKLDSLVLEYIKMTCFLLYTEIRENEKYFVSEGKVYNPGLFAYAMRREEYDSDAKEYFAKLFEKKEFCKYKKILERIFPNVMNYSYSYNLYVGGAIESNAIERTRGIASAKYFPLYFCHTENEFSLIGGCVEKFVEAQNMNPDNMVAYFDGVLKEFPEDAHKELLETIQLYLSDFKEEALVALIRVLVQYYWQLDDSSIFMMLNARRRCTIIIWEALQMICDEAYFGIVDELGYAYDKLELINEVRHWFDKNNKGMNLPGRDEAWRELENDLVEDVLNNNINLYDDTYYHPKNIWGMCRNLSEQNDVFKKYIKSVANGQNIYKILYDVMGHSYGSAHTYYFEKDSIEQFTDIEDVKYWLQSAEAVTDDEKFVQEVFEKSMRADTMVNAESRGVTLLEERMCNFL